MKKFQSGRQETYGTVVCVLSVGLNISLSSQIMSNLMYLYHWLIWKVKSSMIWLILCSYLSFDIKWYLLSIIDIYLLLGPPSLPVIGNYLAIWWKSRKLKYNHNIWSEWAQEYGDLIGLRFGSKNVVVVSGKDMIKEVSSREVFEGRPTGFFYTFRGLGKRRGKVSFTV